MGKRQRIGGTYLKQKANPEYIELLSNLDKQLSKLASTRDKLKEPQDKKYVDLLINHQKTEVREIRTALNQMKMYSFHDGLTMEESFERLDLRKSNGVPITKYAQNIKKLMYQEKAKELFALISQYNLSQSPEDKKKIDSYISSQSDKQLSGIVNSAIAKLKDNYSETLFNDTNILLGYFNKQIVKEIYHPDHQCSSKEEDNIRGINERRVGRADFNGGFYTLTNDDLSKYNPYSLAYQSFTQSHNRSKHYPEDYDLGSSPAWQVCIQSPNFRCLENTLKESMAELSIPPEILKDLNVSDFQHIMTPHRKLDAFKRSFISFKSLSPHCDEGLRSKFRKKLQTPAFDKILQKISVGRGEIAGIEIHHLVAIKDKGTKSNSSDNYAVTINYMSAQERDKLRYDIENTDIHDILHNADKCMRLNPNKKLEKDPKYIDVPLDDRQDGDIVLYMTDTRAEECRLNKQVMCLSGLRDTQFAPFDLINTQSNTNQTTLKNTGASR